MQIEFDLTGGILAANQKYLYMMGYTDAKELVGQHHSMFLEPAEWDSEEYRSFWAKLAAGQDCPFTGYCGDETLLDAIRKALANPAAITSLRDVFNDALQSWAWAFESDINHWHSEEAIREDIEANGYEFNANGTLA